MVDSPSILAAEIRKLEQKHEADPDGRYFVPLANAYRQLGELEHAEVLLQDGLKRHPDYPSAHIVLGRCFLDRGALQGAAKEFQRVLAVDPQNLIALRSLGELAAQEGRWEEAERWYAELVAVDPLNEEARCAHAAVVASAQSSAGPHKDARSEGESRTTVELPVEPETLSGRAGETQGKGADLIPSPKVGDWEEGEVVTQTIAELYARQGLFDQAAAVYRELLRRNEAPDLARRLQEIERLATGAAQGQTAVPALLGAWELTPEADAPVEMLSVPAADAPRQQEVAPAQSIADYLAELLAWTPASRSSEAELLPRHMGPVADQPAERISDGPRAGDGLASGTFDDEYAPPSHPEASALDGHSPAPWDITEQPEHGLRRPDYTEGDEELESFQTWLRSLNR